MADKRKRTSSISSEVKREVEAIVEGFNRERLEPGQCYYEARFRGRHCYLYRFDFGTAGPVCRLAFNGGMRDWGFAIFKWSTEAYDAEDWMFPGSHLVDGTVEGAMRAGLEAYPA